MNAERLVFFRNLHKNTLNDSRPPALVVGDSVIQESPTRRKSGARICGYSNPQVQATNLVSVNLLHVHCSTPFVRQYAHSFFVRVLSVVGFKTVGGAAVLFPVQPVPRRVAQCAYCRYGQCPPRGVAYPIHFLTIAKAREVQ